MTTTDVVAVDLQAVLVTVTVYVVVVVGLAMGFGIVVELKPVAGVQE